MLALLCYGFRHRICSVLPSPRPVITGGPPGVCTSPAVGARLKNPTISCYPRLISWLASSVAQDFSEETLRTLCLAYKELGEEEYQTWRIQQNEALLSLERRQARLEKVYEDMEKDLQLLGATAIEDKLQVGVPETMQRLQDANIKVWMLTGDKKETAVNIAYSSNLLSSHMELLEEEDIRHLLESDQWDGSNVDATIKEMDRLVRKDNHKKALVMTGDFLSGFVGTSETPEAALPWWRRLLHSLRRKEVKDLQAVAKAKALVELACRCHSVICCRVTPQQKAGIVQLVKTNKKVTTLAIGDGGNDVNMIKTAHIGVGVAGKEGLQAVLASEFSIAQFSYLQSLLLFHGRISYARIYKFLGYTDYRTFTFIIFNVWYAFFNAFSSLPLFDSFYILFTAILYTLYPPMCIGIFDKDADSKSSRQRPELYRVGQKDGHLAWYLLLSILYGFYTSLVSYFVPYLAFRDTAGPGAIFDYQVLAFTVCTLTILAMSAEVILTICTWNWVSVLLVTISVGSYFLIQYLSGLPSAFFFNMKQFGFLNVMVAALGSGYIWLTLLLGLILALIPSLLWRFWSGLVTERPRKEAPVQLLKRKKPRRQSSFAFSYTEGYSRFISDSGSLHIKPAKKKLGCWKA